MGIRKAPRPRLDLAEPRGRGLNLFSLPGTPYPIEPRVTSAVAAKVHAVRRHLSDLISRQIKITRGRRLRADVFLKELAQETLGLHRQFTLKDGLEHADFSRLAAGSSARAVAFFS